MRGEERLLERAMNKRQRMGGSRLMMHKDVQQKK